MKKELFSNVLSLVWNLLLVYVCLVVCMIVGIRRERCVVLTVL